jgi:hypothetical protein
LDRQNQAFEHGLRDQQAVERVTMMPRQPGCVLGVWRGDYQ